MQTRRKKAEAERAAAVTPAPELATAAGHVIGAEWRMQAGGGFALVLKTIDGREHVVTDGSGAAVCVSRVW